MIEFGLGGWSNPAPRLGCGLGPPVTRTKRAGLPMMVAAWCTLAAVPAVARAQSGAPAPAAGPAADGFVHESWTVRDGLPVNSVTWMLQGRDGYLWIATFDGLVRFDGARFAVFSSSNSAGLPSNRITGLLEARDGSLWLLTDQYQLVRFRAGEFTQFGPERGLHVEATAVHEDPGGNLWVGTRRGLGVIRDERFVAVGQETIRAWSLLARHGRRRPAPPEAVAVHGLGNARRK